MNAKQEIKLDEAHNAIVKQNILKIRQTFYLRKRSFHEQE